MAIEDIEGRTDELEGDVERLEADAEETEAHEESLDEAVHRLAADVAVAEALRDNQRAVERDRQEIRERHSELAGTLSTLESQLALQMEALESDRSVLESLASIGEDVSESLALLDEKQQWLEACQEQLIELAGRLDVALEAYDIGDSSGSRGEAASRPRDVVVEERREAGEAGSGAGADEPDVPVSDFNLDSSLGLSANLDETGSIYTHGLGLTPGYGPYRWYTAAQSHDAQRATGAAELRRKVPGLGGTKEPIHQLADGGTLYDSPEVMHDTLNWYQGLASAGYQGTCGLCSVQNIARLAGKNLSEADVVALARRKGLCESDPTATPGERGGTNPLMRQKLLKKLGIKSHIDYEQNTGHIAELVEHGHGVIVPVEVRNFWKGAAPFDQAGGHAVVVTSVERDAQGRPRAFHICDSGIHDANYVVSADKLRASLRSGRGMNVTDKPIR